MMNKDDWFRNPLLIGTDTNTEDEDEDEETETDATQNWRLIECAQIHSMFREWCVFARLCLPFGSYCKLLQGDLATIYADLLRALQSIHHAMPVTALMRLFLQYGMTLSKFCDKNQDTNKNRLILSICERRSKHRHVHRLRCIDQPSGAYVVDDWYYTCTNRLPSWMVPVTDMYGQNSQTYQIV